MTNIAFVESLKSFKELTLWVRQKIWWEAKDGVVCVAGRYGYRARKTDPDYPDVQAWCQEAHKIIDSIPEELVFFS